MSLVCDGCGDDLSKLPRPECYVPLSDGGSVDLCPDCSAALATIVGGDAENIPSVQAGDVTVVVDPEEHEAVIGRRAEALWDLADDLEARAETHESNGEEANTDRMAHTCDERAEGYRSAAQDAREKATNMVADDE